MFPLLGKDFPPSPKDPVAVLPSNVQPAGTSQPLAVLHSQTIISNIDFSSFWPASPNPCGDYGARQLMDGLMCVNVCVVVCVCVCVQGCNKHFKRGQAKSRTRFVNVLR